MSFQDDINERLAAANAAAGWEPFTPAQQRWIDNYAKRVAAATFCKPSCGPINATPEGKALASEAIEAWTYNRRIRPEQFNPIARRPGCDYDMAKPWTMDRLLCIVARYPTKAFPLDNFNDWQTISPSTFGVDFRCDFRLSANCGKIPAWDRMPLRLGEFVTVHRICDHCFRWFYASTAELAQTYRDDLCGNTSVEPTNSVRHAELLAVVEPVAVRAALKRV